MTEQDPQSDTHADDAWNQRLEARILSEVTIFVETYSSPTGEAISPNIVISKTLDLSANGLQVVMDHALPLGSILEICIDFGLQQPRYHLIGEVRWVRKAPGSLLFLTGFQLLDSEGTQIEEWKKRIVELLADSRTQIDQG